MKELTFLVIGFTLGCWYKSASEERKALRKENEILKSRNTEKKD